MRTIRRSRKYDELVSKLAEKPVSELLAQKIFPTYKALMCFAACVGFQSEYEHDVVDPIDFVDSRVIERDSDCIDLIYLIGLAKSRDTNILRDGAENETLLATTFERCCEGGLAVMQRWMQDTPSDPYGYDAIIAAMQKCGYLPVPSVQASAEEPTF